MTSSYTLDEREIALKALDDVFSDACGTHPDMVFPEHRKKFEQARDTLLNIERTAACADAESLFRQGDFTLAGGARSLWKIECDALTTDDWATLALMTWERMPAFGQAVGVPRGGMLFAEALASYATHGPTLIVDDVLTTGASILRIMSDYPDSVGLVAFARGPLPEGVKAIWTRAAGRAELEEPPVVYRRVGRGDKGILYALHGSSSISYASAAEAKITELKEARADAVAEVERYKTMLYNLLARIFRDGGQRIDTFDTLEEAVAQADIEVADWIVGQEARIEALVSRTDDMIEAAIELHREDNKGEEHTQYWQGRLDGLRAVRTDITQTRASQVDPPHKHVYSFFTGMCSCDEFMTSEVIKVDPPERMK